MGEKEFLSRVSKSMERNKEALNRLKDSEQEEILRPLTLYISQKEFEDLEKEAKEAGRSGVSSQIRYILGIRRSKNE